MFNSVRLFLIKAKYNRHIEKLGGGTQLKKNSVIKLTGNSKLEAESFLLNQNAFLCAAGDGFIEIKEDVTINRNSIIVCRDKIIIGKGCSIGPNVCIYDHDHSYGREGVKKGYKSDNIVIEDNCWIGAGVIILRGTHIGQGSVIGAGCVIKDEIPSHSLVTMERCIKIQHIV